MTVLLWIVAFIGVGLIYGAKPLYKLAAKKEPGDAAVNVIKGIGTLLAIGGVALLYTLDLLL